MFALLATLEVPDTGWTSRDHFPSLAELTDLAHRRGARTVSGHPIRFVPQRPKARRRRSAGPSYEQQIFATGEIPTRIDNWHDLFNALTWALFPRSKAALNGRQITARVEGMVRSREQDRLAMFDEGGMILVTYEGARVEPFVFGHAVLEEAVNGRVAAQVLVLPFARSSEDGDRSLEQRIATLDAAAAELITSGFFSAAGSRTARVAEYFT